MTSSIGLRFYKVTAHTKHQRGDEPCDPSELREPVHEFLSAFVDAHSDAVQDDQAERSWHFERQESEVDASIRGYIRYGTFGFESIFRNTRTRSTTYERQVDDVEEVPLFFEFWQPSETERHIFSFQSFHGRSCISLVLGALQNHFEAANPNHTLRVKKIISIDSPNSLYKDADVKKLTFLRDKVFSDRFTAYAKNGEVKSVKFTMSVRPQRGASFGSLSEILGEFEPNKNGLVVVEGQEFNEAIATVLVGDRYRPVGIFGPTVDTGAIDVTEVVVKGPNGHPTFESIAEQSDLIMIDINRRIGKDDS